MAALSLLSAVSAWVRRAAGFRGGCGVDGVGVGTVRVRGAVGMPLGVPGMVRTIGGGAGGGALEESVARRLAMALMTAEDAARTMSSSARRIGTMMPKSKANTAVTAKGAGRR